jgi:catecholate siderophore receptor
VTVGFFVQRNGHAVLDQKKGMAFMTWKAIGIGLLIFTLFTLAAFGPARSAWAQADTVTVNIPPQDLSSALNTFAEQTNLQILYASDLAGGLTTKGAVGTVTPQEAVRQLLEGTGLQYTFTDAKTVTLQMAAPLAPTSQAEPLGSAAPPTAKAKPVKIPEVVVKEVRERDYVAKSSTTATKTDTPLRDIPQTVNVVTQQLIRDQAALSMQDVLRNVPGVGFSHGDGQRDQVTIRGFNAIADQFVDGFRDDALYFRDLSNIERIEVIKGPAAVLFGRGSSGGLINRVTKKPQAGTFGEVTTILGSFAQRRVSADVNTQAGERVAVRMTGAFEDSGSYRDQQFLDRYTFAPSLSIQLGAQTTLLLQGDHAFDKRLTDFGIPSFNGRPVNVPIGTYYGSGDARRDDTTTTEVSSGRATLNHRFNDALSVRNSTRYYTYHLDRHNTLPGGTVDTATLTVKRNRGDITRQEFGLFNQTDFIFKNTLGGFEQDWLFGLELGRQNKFSAFANQANIDSVSIFNPGGKVAPPLSAATLAGNAAIPSDTTLDVIGLYMQNQITLAKEWKAVAGVRYDSLKQATEFHRTLPPLSRTDRAWSPRAGLIWQPNETVSYYISYSKSFQPSAEAFALAANNADREPEITQNREIGTKLNFWEGVFSVTGSVFNMERTNIKTTDPANLTRLINVGEQRTNGLELTANGRLPLGVDLSAGYAYLDGRIVKSTSFQNSPQTPVVAIPLEGKQPSLTPKHSAFVWAVKELGYGFSAGGGVNYVGNRFASPSNAVVLPSYVTADLAVFYRARGYDISFNVKNVAGTEYIISSHGSNDNLILPGPPREFLVSLRYHF